MSFWPPSRRSRRRRSHLELALEYISTGGGSGGSRLRDSAFKSIIIPNGNTLCEPLHVRAKNNFPRLINDLHHQIQARTAYPTIISFFFLWVIQQLRGPNFTQF